MTTLQSLGVRLLVFALALLSFACLLGQFYGFWTMQVIVPSSSVGTKPEA